MTADARPAFLDAAAQAVALLGRPELVTRWDEPSSLAELSVAGLAGHLLRAVTTVETYLDAADQPGPDEAPLPAEAYFHRLALTPDISSRANTDIRARSLQSAAGGPAAVAAEARACRDRLTARLRQEPGDRRVKVAGGLVLTLDGYLATRIVELLVHTDDLAVSVGVPELPPSPAAATLAFTALLGTARMRHGDLAVLRALARRERDTVEALRVL